MPIQSLILCASPRSGSTLFCDLVAETGVAGRPDSYFRKESVPNWAKRLGVPLGGEAVDFERAYLAAVLNEGSAGTGVFSARMMWQSMTELSERLGMLYPGLPSDAARFGKAFGRAIYVYLSRPNKVAQAVSLLKATQSGLWHKNDDGTVREGPKKPSSVSYNASQIAQHLAELRWQDEAWNGWFDENGIGPVKVSYDDLTADPQREVERVLLALGRDTSHAMRVKPRTAKLADDESVLWISRFLEDQAQLGEQNSTNWPIW